MSEGHGIISSDIIPSLIRRPTRGRTISMANHVHAPQGNMSGGHGIISVDIIPALASPEGYDCANPFGGNVDEGHFIMEPGL